MLHALLQVRVDNVRHVAVAADTASALLSGWSAGAWIVAGVGGPVRQPELSVAPHTHLRRDFASLATLVAPRSPYTVGSSGMSATELSSRLTVPVSANTT